MAIKFVDVPLENHLGEGLTVCRNCGGAGAYFNCEKQVEDKKTGEVMMARKKAFSKSISSLLRGGWSATHHKCKDCGGSGMLVKGR